MEEEGRSSKNQNHPLKNRTLNRKSGNIRGQHNRGPTSNAQFSKMNKANGEKWCRVQNTNRSGFPHLVKDQVEAVKIHLFLVFKRSSECLLFFLFYTFIFYYYRITGTRMFITLPANTEHNRKQKMSFVKLVNDSQVSMK